MWPISGLVWPSGLVLARVVSQLNLTNMSVLEVGCGIGIASLIAAYKDADITASDYHPLVETLLFKNAEENDIHSIKYIHGNWNYPISNHGKFDLIIGSDLLYEKAYCELLSVYINCHLAAKGKVMLIDPGRRKAGKIKKSMEDLGFQYKAIKVDEEGKVKKNGNFTQYIFQKT
jgi:predicted nicotinamide N-methyase